MNKIRRTVIGKKSGMNSEEIRRRKEERSLKMKGV